MLVQIESSSVSSKKFSCLKAMVVGKSCSDPERNTDSECTHDTFHCVFLSVEEDELPMLSATFFWFWDMNQSCWKKRKSDKDGKYNNQSLFCSGCCLFAITSLSLQSMQNCALQLWKWSLRRDWAIGLCCPRPMGCHSLWTSGFYWSPLKYSTKKNRRYVSFSDLISIFVFWLATIYFKEKTTKKFCGGGLLLFGRESRNRSGGPHRRVYRRVHNPSALTIPFSDCASAKAFRGPDLRAHMYPACFAIPGNNWNIYGRSGLHSNCMRPVKWTTIRVQ